MEATSEALKIVGVLLLLVIGTPVLWFLINFMVKWIHGEPVLPSQVKKRREEKEVRREKANR